MTLDGYFEGQEPWSLDFHQSVWGEELERFSIEQLDGIGTLLFGRKTYEGMASYFSADTGEVADRMNAIPKAVVSRTLETADWQNTRLLKGEGVDAVRALKEEPGQDIYVFGSADLLASVEEAGLIDEYRICLAPVTLGAGNPLFKPGSKPQDMALLDAKTLTNGGVILRYVPRPK